MPFGLKNAPAVFSRIVIKKFQEYIYKTMAVYFDDWTIYSMLKDHCKWLRPMLERCRQIQLSLNIRKCIFVTPIGILLGHIVCKEGIKVNFTKIKIILNLKPPVNPKQVKVLLGHIGYYWKFIRYYSDMNYPLEELLREDQEFKWTEECHISFEKLKKKISRSPHLKVSKLVDQVPCPYWCTGNSNRSNPNSTKRWWNGLSHSLQ